MVFTVKNGLFKVKILLILLLAGFGNARSENLMIKNNVDSPATTSVVEEQSSRAFSMRLGAERIWIENPYSVTGNAMLTIYDLEGELVMTEALYIDGLGATIVSFPQTLKPGIYISTLQVGRDMYSDQGLVR